MSEKAETRRLISTRTDQPLTPTATPHYPLDNDKLSSFG